jgi:hypothetical protein
MDPIAPARPYFTSADREATAESSSSGVSWGAVMAGALGGAALSLALLALGAGIGFSSVSPWTHNGASAKAIGWGAIGWMVLMQLLASALAGYLAGRLRTKWVNVHTHEVYFRDTAHGFLAWSVGMVLTAGFLTSAAATLVGGAAGAAAATAPVVATSESGAADRYRIDTMLRTTNPAADRNTALAQAEIAPILAASLARGSMLPADREYLAQLVAARTGVSQTEAERRVDEADRDAREAADTARKAAAHSLYWTFLALLVGAFTASLAATFGGRERDKSPDFVRKAA